MDQYIEDGQVFLELKHYAFLGEESIRAAEAAFCAADQGEFWQYHETLFANQQTPPHNNGGFSEDRVLEMGELTGLDMNEFEPCVTEREHQDDVQDMVSQAQDIGITGTPQFEVNGRVVPFEGWETLQQEIEAELN